MRSCIVAINSFGSAVMMVQVRMVSRLALRIKPLVPQTGHCHQTIFRHADCKRLPVTLTPLIKVVGHEKASLPMALRLGRSDGAAADQGKKPWL